MVIVKVDLPSNINDLFKAKVIDKFGLRRGAITSALIEAIEIWIDQNIVSDGETSEIGDFEVQENQKDKFLAVVNNEIKISANSLNDLWDNLPPDPQHHYSIYTPDMPAKRRVKLGWLGSFKRK